MRVADNAGLCDKIAIILHKFTITANFVFPPGSRD